MNERLLQYLVEHRYLSAGQAEFIRSEQQRTGKNARELLSDGGQVSEEQLIEALSFVSRVPVVRLYDKTLPEIVRGQLRPDMLRANTIFPFEIDEAGTTLTVAVADPMNMRGRDMIALVTHLRVRMQLATASEIQAAIDRVFGVGVSKAAIDQYINQDSGEGGATPEELSQQADVSSSVIVVLVNSLIEQAVRRRASDIHVEPGPDQVRVRYRVDGVLFTVNAYDTRLLSSIVTRIKIMSGLDISEKRKPQDGRCTSIVDGVEYDIRVSTLPTVYGEKSVLRLAQKKALRRQKSALGLEGVALEKFDRMLAKPNGVILVTGPTGSGKSTTMYTALSELNREDVNIVTVEDPVEANIDGVNQVQVNPKAELTFAVALRSILRQDPDIIMVGEIRDAETAAIAMQASITGHLVLTTLHTNDTASSVMRLMDMGIESYLIADATTGIIAQRLLRRLCPHCKRPHKLLPYEARFLGLTPGEARDITVYEPEGCQRCGGAGYYDRIGVYEIMEMTPRVRALIAENATAAELREAALSDGMVTLQQGARDLVLRGITSIAEVQRLSAADAAGEEPWERSDGGQSDA